MKRGILIVIFAILLAISGCCNANSNDTEEFDVEEYITNLVNKELPPKKYNLNIRPNFGKEPVLITISLNINDISDVSEQSMDFQIEFSIRHYWNDHRLKFDVKHNISEISVEESFAHKLWLPDTFFGDSKQLKVHKTVFTDDTTLLRLHSNGDIVYSTKVSMKASCSMDLRYFPVDQQKCSLDFGSFGKTTDEVIYQWKNETPVEFSKEIELPSFLLIGYNKHNGTETTSLGEFSKLYLEFVIARYIDFYLSQVYIPAALVVIISWVPFWLNRDSQARVALGVTTVLTMTTLTTTLNSDFPKISHLTALDVYLFVCFAQVFLSLIEYATIGYFDVKVERREEKMQMKQLGEAEAVFPTSFILFVVVYAIVLITITIRNGHAKVEVRLDY
ncbi:hypothetical protein TYRP_001175 [Tyrophagus putrescentiae]|nr:hypothetical protein TYRP_001175 [Tyrophagus putrescentiae]